MRRRRVGAALLLAMGLAPLGAQGLGLGRLSGEAVLGEPLQLTIPLTGVAGAPLDNECIILGRPRDAIDAEYFPRDLRSRVERRDGASYLVLTSTSVLRQPLVEFRVAIQCGYNLAHDYVLMASPRQAAPPTPGPRQSPEAAPPSPVAWPPPAIASPDGRGMPDGVPAKVFLVERSLTLAELARLHFPGPLRRERFARWVVEANPELFAGVRDVLGHRFQPGQQVLVPAGVPPRRPGDHQTPPAPAATDDIPAAPVPAARSARGAVAGKGPGRDEGRLVIGAAGGTARDLRETLALVDRLAGMLELQVVAQNANDERLRTLEATVAELTKSLAQVETGARQDEAKRQAELTALRRTLAERSDLSWLTLIAAILGGGLAGAGLLHLLRRLAGRGEAAPVVAPAPLATLDGFPEPAPAPEERPQPVASATAAVAPRAPVAPAPVAPRAPSPAARPSPPVAAPPRPAPVQIDFQPPTPAKPVPTTRPLVDLEPGVSDPAAEAIELANVMVSMGLANSAAQTLVQHIQDNPRQSLFQWLKLLELHRATGNRDQFEASAQEMSQHFNVQPAQWADEAAMAGRQSLEAYPHLRAQLLAVWGTPECTDFLQRLLIDNREGTRVGFPLLVAEEILLLLAIHDVRR